MDYDDDIIDFDDKTNLASTPEGKLLTSILHQAVEDAIYQPSKVKNTKTENSERSIASKNRIAIRDKVDAIRWLFDDNEVYDLCCEITGLHKENVRQLVIDKVGANIILPLVHEFYRPNGY
jgi:hypothetical protein